jgi:small subunit ribosomal protein S20
MANLKSSRKQARQNVKRRAINISRKTSLKTAVRRVMDALKNNNVEEAQLFFKDAQAKLARAGGKGLLHDNTAGRKVSKLAKKVAVAGRTEK